MNCNNSLTHVIRLNGDGYTQGQLKELTYQIFDRTGCLNKCATNNRITFCECRIVTSPFGETHEFFGSNPGTVADFDTWYSVVQFLVRKGVKRH